MKYKSKYEIYCTLYRQYKLDKINEADIINLTGLDVYRLKEYINNTESCREVVI